MACCTTLLLGAAMLAAAVPSEAADGSPVTIENKTIAMTIHPQAGTISRLAWKGRSMAVGREINSDSLFALTVGRPMTKDVRELTSRDCVLVDVQKTAPDALRLCYANAAYSLEVTCTFTLHDAQVYCGMEIANNGTVDVVRIRYPRVRGSRWTNSRRRSDDDAGGLFSHHHQAR